MDIAIIASLALVFTVSVLIAAEIKENRRIIYVVKPLSTILVILVAVVGSAGSASLFGQLILVGLLLSLGGDVMLMPPDTPIRFRWGLVLFLAAHVAYIAAFWKPSGWQRADLIIGAVLIVFAVAYFRILLPNLGSMKVPVAVYIIIITLMLSRALSLLFVDGFPESRARLAAAGAALFFISDLILSANRFWKPWRYNRYSLACYFGGQLCLAWAVGA